jgi:hypothetical protein
MPGKANSATVFDLGTTLPPQHVNLEVDLTRQRQYGRWMLLGLVLLCALLFNLWQRNDPVTVVRETQAVEKQRKEEEALARKYDLEVLTLTSPQSIDTIATYRLRMVPAGRDDLVILQRFVPAPAPPASVVALR